MQERQILQSRETFPPLPLKSCGPKPPGFLFTASQNHPKGIFLEQNEKVTLVFPERGIFTRRMLTAPGASWAPPRILRALPAQIPGAAGPWIFLEVQHHFLQGWDVPTSRSCQTRSHPQGNSHTQECVHSRDAPSPLPPKLSFLHPWISSFAFLGKLRD